MCIILPVAHIPCTHTLSIWHHCIDAARSGTPCWNVRQHDRAILSRKLCKDCGGDRFFARRGGVAERGEGSPPPTRDGIEKSYQDDADDSGYCSNSDAIAEEEDEEGDDFDFPLSPRATVPPRGRGERRHREKQARPLNRKASWKPNLKQELSGKSGPATSRTRRESIDELVEGFGAYSWNWQGGRTIGSSTTGKESTQKRRPSTLLHPSSPAEETFTFQTVTALPFAQVVHIRKPSGDARRSILATKTFTPPISASPSDTTEPHHKNPHRKLSTLLHPSPSLPTQHTSRTIISIPPRRERRPSTTSRYHASPSSLPTVSRRRPSILHSSLSDTESDDNEGPRDWATNSFAAYAAEQAEGALLAGTARAARVSRGRMSGKDIGAFA